MVKSKPENSKIAITMIARTVVYAFAIFGVLFIFILAGVALIVGPRALTSSVPEKAILEIDFNQNYAESRGDDFFAEFTGASVYSVFDLVRAINIAASDDKVKAIKANINASSLGLAQIQDISNAINVFKSSGKQAYIYSSSIGFLGGGSKDYYLASNFSQIWLQPSAEIGVTGVNIEVPFFNKVLKKIGVEPEFYSRYEYKTAVSSLISSDFTAEYKEELNKVGGGLFNQLVEQIAKNRNLSNDDVKKVINEAPVDAEFALQSKFIDKIAYEQELNTFLKKEYDAEFVSIDSYMSAINEYDDKNFPLVAFLVLDGIIEDGVSSNSPLNEAVIGSQSVIKQIEELKNKENLKALVIRLNSPGGSYTASDEIRFALEDLKKEKNIPIVVSMGNYAASGGYFISLAADYVVAMPATFTGSIGVVGGKIVLKKLWENLDINWGEISFGDNAGILSYNHTFSKKEQKIFNASLDRIYQDFTTKVMNARKLDKTQMDNVARGRVWLGTDAVRLGLIDALGGIEYAILKAKDLSGIKPTDKFLLLYFPRKQSFQEKLVKYIESGGGLPAIEMAEKYGLNIRDMKMLHYLRYDTIMLPFKVSM